MPRQVRRLHRAQGHAAGSYAGPWFQPNLHRAGRDRRAERLAAVAAPSIRAIADERLAYVLALRNYAFASSAVARAHAAADRRRRLSRSGRRHRAALRSATRSGIRRRACSTAAPTSPGTREAAHGMTLERTVRVGELGGNTVAFPNYAVAYYDARGGARVPAPVEDGHAGRRPAQAQRHEVRRGQFRVQAAVQRRARRRRFRRICWPARCSSTSCPTRAARRCRAPDADRHRGQGQARRRRPAGTSPPMPTTRTQAGDSPWTKMAPVGLMWGNDPDGAPITESWINPAAPAYARAHLGVDGRLNGPVDNPASACMSCHSTAQAPSLAPMLPTGACAQAPFRADWFRNLARHDGLRPPPAVGSDLPDRSPPASRVTAADYSLQLSATVARALPTANGGQTFNPCTWDERCTAAVGAGRTFGAGGAPAARGYRAIRGHARSGAVRVGGCASGGIRSAGARCRTVNPEV